MIEENSLYIRKKISDIEMVYFNCGKDSTFRFEYNNKSFLLLHAMDVVNGENIVYTDLWWISILKKNRNFGAFNGMGVSIDGIDVING